MSLADPNRFEQLPLVLETNMLPLTPRIYKNKKIFSYETPFSKIFKSEPVVTLNSPKFMLYQEIIGITLKGGVKT